MDNKGGITMAEENDNGGSMFKMLGIFVLMIIIAAGTSYGVMTYFSPDRQVESRQPEFGPTYTLGDFTVNLSGSGGYQFIKSSIVVGVTTEEVITELEKRSPQVRDAIISIMRNAQISEIEDPDAKAIKEKLKSELNTILNTGKVSHVWFTQLVVQ